MKKRLKKKQKQKKKQKKRRQAKKKKSAKDDKRRPSKDESEYELEIHEEDTDIGADDKASSVGATSRKSDEAPVQEDKDHRRSEDEHKVPIRERLGRKVDTEHGEGPSTTRRHKTPPNQPYSMISHMKMDQIKKYVDARYGGYRRLTKKHFHHQDCNNQKCEEDWSGNTRPCTFYNTGTCEKKGEHSTPGWNYKHVCLQCHYVLGQKTKHSAPCNSCPTASLQEEMEREIKEKRYDPNVEPYVPS